MTDKIKSLKKTRQVSSIFLKDHFPTFRASKDAVLLSLKKTLGVEMSDDQERQQNCVFRSRKMILSKDKLEVRRNPYSII